MFSGKLLGTALWLAVLSACVPTVVPDPPVSSCVGDSDSEDADGDGICADLDCDDDDPTVYPGAPELCDGQVNACGGALSEAESDADQDGFITCTGLDHRSTQEGHSSALVATL